MSAFHFMGTHSYREPADTFVESKSNSKICTYIKTYFSLYDLSLQFRSGQSRARWGGGFKSRFRLEYRLPADTS
jgi:hypothetical protein